jgi:hypothetical protein
MAVSAMMGDLNRFDCDFLQQVLSPRSRKAAEIMVAERMRRAPNHVL